MKRLEDKGLTGLIVGFRIPYGPDIEPPEDSPNLKKFAEA